MLEAAGSPDEQDRPYGLVEQLFGPGEVATEAGHGPAVGLADGAVPAVAEPYRPQPTELDWLSREERRVAALASIGCTNKGILVGLCITVSTVEQHMTMIYRKAGIRQRQDLSRLMTPDSVELKTVS